MNLGGRRRRRKASGPRSLGGHNPQLRRIKLGTTPPRPPGRLKVRSQTFGKLTPRERKRGLTGVHPWPRLNMARSCTTGPTQRLGQQTAQSGGGQVRLQRPQVLSPVGSAPLEAVREGVPGPALGQLGGAAPGLSVLRDPQAHSVQSALVWEGCGQGLNTHGHHW